MKELLAAIPQHLDDKRKQAIKDYPLERQDWQREQTILRKLRELNGQNLPPPTIPESPPSRFNPIILPIIISVAIGIGVFLSSFKATQ